MSKIKSSVGAEFHGEGSMLQLQVDNSKWITNSFRSNGGE